MISYVFFVIFEEFEKLLRIFYDIFLNKKNILD